MQMFKKGTEESECVELVGILANKVMVHSVVRLLQPAIFFFFGEYNQRYEIYQQSPDSFQHGPESRIIGAGAVWKCSIDQFRLEQKKRGLVNNVDQIKHRWNIRGGKGEIWKKNSYVIFIKSL